jgi:hypothetical protein
MEQEDEEAVAAAEAADLTRHEELLARLLAKLYGQDTISAKQAMRLKHLFEEGDSVVAHAFRIFDRAQDVTELEESLATIAHC